MTNSIDRINKYPLSFLNRDINSDTGKRFQIFAREVEELKIMFLSLQNLQDYETQTGKTLDNIGKNLNRERAGMDDEKYKIFLSIAVQKRKSKGDLYSMNQIAEKILAGNGALFKISELCYGGEPSLLDGSGTWNGETPMSGTTKLPATIEVIFTGDADNLQAYPEFNRAIADIRAGGVDAVVDYKFTIQINVGKIYINYSSVWDGNSKLDGNTILSSPTKLYPASIALGDGGESFPGNPILPGNLDTGLNHELIRKNATINIRLDGTREYAFNMKQSELIGKRINEIALFGSSNELLFKKTFIGKDKDNIIKFDFSILEKAA